MEIKFSLTFRDLNRAIEKLLEIQNITPYNIINISLDFKNITSYGTTSHNALKIVTRIILENVVQTKAGNPN